MSEVEQDLDRVSVTIDEAQHKIDLSAALRRLEKNKDFKLLVLDGLLRKDAIAQVMLRAAPQLKAPGPGAEAALAGIDTRIAMIGELNDYFRCIHIEGEQMSNAIHEHENTREELLAEQLNED